MEIDKAFGGKPELKVDDFVDVTTNVCTLPKFMNKMLFQRIDLGKKGAITKMQFMTYWKQNFEKIESKRRHFNLIAKPGQNYIVADDFKPLF